MPRSGPLSDSGDPSAALERGGPQTDFEDLFETAPCGYISTDKNGAITRANRTFADWLGTDTAALAGRRFADLLPMGARIYYETHIAPMLHMQGSLSEVALDVIAADGRRIPMLVNAVERDGTAGAPGFIRFTLFIATERRSYERRLITARDEAQADVAAERAEAELREQFIAVLGHDLRNPLASIASGITLLGKEDLSTRGRRVIGLMAGSVVRATGLIDNVLDFARGRLGGGLPLARDASEPLEPVLRHVVAELRSIDPGRIVEASYALHGPIDCDRMRIGQLLSNLLGNALTHGASDEPVRIEAATTDTELVIRVCNGGTPIPVAALDRLFEPFYRAETQTPQEGLGLGLHIAAEIARAHGGTLVARSDSAETSFTFTMPLMPADHSSV